ncbi:MAG: ubiquinol-cytochrome c reductase iron-sulfur subunit [Nitrospinota bacterium]
MRETPTLEPKRPPVHRVPPDLKLPREYREEALRRQGMSRRRFLNWAGWIGVLGSVAVGLLGMVRFMFPRVLFEPPLAFKAGRPDEYPVGTVSTKYKLSQRVWIVHEPEGFYVLLAICTHLGCTPNWLASDNKFKCPCHGSGFWKSGINFEGPAPRPLERIKVTLAEDGQLLIDKSKTFRYERGQWDDPDAFLRV